MLNKTMKKVFYTGIGIAAVTAKKTGEIIDSLEQKGEKTVKENKILNEELKQKLSTVESSVKEVMDSLEKMSKEEVDYIKEKLSQFDAIWEKAEDEVKMDTEEIISSLGKMSKEEIGSVKAKIDELQKNWTDDSGEGASE